jgi:ABC-2 type transport system permease protein
MEDEVKRYLKLLVHYFVQYAKVRMAYRWDFILSALTMTMASVFGLAFVYLMFAKIPSLAGWSFHEIVLLYGFSLIPISIFNMLSINLYYFSENYIVQGKFDRVLLRPVDSLFQILFEQFRLESLGDGVIGIGLIIYCSVRLHLEASVLDWVMLAWSALCGATLYISIFLILTSISFWMEDRVGVMPPVYNMMAFGRYPLDIYNGAVRFLLSWVLPFGFATFYPAANLLRPHHYRMYASILPIITAVFLAIGIAVWRRGVRNYSSTGS